MSIGLCGYDVADAEGLGQGVDLVQLGFACAFDIDDHIGFDDHYVSNLLLIASRIVTTRDTDVLVPCKNLWISFEADIIV